MRTGDAAAAVGKGLLAGMVGTAAMTLSSTAEMKLRGRAPSSAPADAAAKVLGVEPTGDQEKARFSTVVHWAYGTGWGALRGLLGAFGMKGPLAAGAHFAAVWGSELTTLPALGVAPSIKDWGAAEVGIDAAHHLVYAASTSLAYAFLDRR
ncbi:MAG TPA: hypothetical protein VK988_05070 [Acidimicrobiales bacterium]|nr:hypothetical protein [Acidimicrobiales bacterium]